MYKSGAVPFQIIKNAEDQSCWWLANFIQIKRTLTAAIVPLRAFIMLPILARMLHSSHLVEISYQNDNTFLQNVHKYLWYQSEHT